MGQVEEGRDVPGSADYVCPVDAATKVRILLDVDGVLNAVTRSPDPEQWPDWQVSTAMGFRISYSPTVGQFFRRMAEADGVEVLWLTTWAEMANEYICPMLDIPACVVAGSPPPYRERRWWKLDVAQRLWDTYGTPFVWIDDDLGFSDDGATEWIHSLDGQAIGVRPDTLKGLTPRLLGEIEAFVDRHRPDSDLSHKDGSAGVTNTHNDTPTSG